LDGRVSNRRTNGDGRFRDALTVRDETPGALTVSDDDAAVHTGALPAGCTSSRLDHLELTAATDSTPRTGHAFT
jgi:hypothetical protein